MPGRASASRTAPGPVRGSALLALASVCLGLPTALAAHAADEPRVAPLQPRQQLALAIPLPPPAPRVFAITPERRALLNTIRYAEGTWANGHDIGYRIMFGGGLMPSLDRHPDRVVRSARYASAAAGAYQFMPPTWSMVTRALGFQLQGPEAFGPQVQDQAALFLVQRRGALALADQGIFSPELAHRLAPEWASFPTIAGRSFYGQPVKRYDELRRFYEQNLAELRSQPALGSSEVSAEPPRPACTPAGSLRCQLEALDNVGPRGRS
jgi:lysozyme